MSNFFWVNKIVPLTVLAHCFWLPSCRDFGSEGTSEKSVNIAVVSKVDQTPFYARIPTNIDRILVTSPALLSGGQRINIPDNSNLFYVELTEDTSERIDTEVFKFDRVRLFLADNEHHASFLLQRFTGFPHARKVPLEKLKNTIDSGAWLNLVPPLPDKSPHKIIDIDPIRLRLDLESLSGAKAVVINGREVFISNRASMQNKALARAWLRQQFESLGYLVSEHDYGSGINLSAEKTAANSENKKIILVTAHLDTVQTAGADDNGSGLSTMLTAARALAPESLNNTLRFVAFDEEERGLIGSSAYAKSLRNNQEISNVSVINLEMTGYDSDNDGELHVIDCNENTSSELTDVIISTINTINVPLHKTPACTTRSDHASFWEYDRPAVVISQNFFGGDANPCYHRTCDKVEEINFQYMSHIAKAVVNAIFNLASREMP